MEMRVVDGQALFQDMQQAFGLDQLVELAGDLGLPVGGVVLLELVEVFGLGGFEELPELRTVEREGRVEIRGLADTERARGDGPGGQLFGSRAAKPSLDGLFEGDFLGVADRDIHDVAFK
ncbi:hypothetical protein NBRC3255_2663 [Gluconobacter thailandicus NBRC 3255]|nr:hypothetical protein NBRC3255_2663 [Gluconobacter thailandicus NBRC 3255]